MNPQNGSNRAVANGRRPASIGTRADLTVASSQPEETVTHLIDVAHAALSSDDLAAVLVVTLREAEILRRGELPARPRGRLREGHPDLRPAARAYLRPIRVELFNHAIAASERGRSELVALGERIAAHAEDVAALPKGCPVVMVP